MKRLSHVTIEGLFGDVDHDIDIRGNDPTIIAGPNGVGKTHVLRIVQALLKTDTRYLAAADFTGATIEFADRSALAVTRTLIDDDSATLTFLAKSNGQVVGEPITVSAASDGPDPDETIPPYVRPVAPGRWYDSRSDRVISTALVERRYGVRLSGGTANNFPKDSKISQVLESINRPIFIDTKRLDNPITYRGDSQVRGDQWTTRAGTIGDNRPAASRIDMYVDRIRVQLTDARRASVSATQSADLSFAVRALAAARDRVNERGLRERYNRIVDRYEELTSNGLATGEAPLAFPDNTTPTVRRILSVFLDDWEQRLEPLIPLNERLKLLRAILDKKFAATGKTTRISPRGALGFKGHDGRPVLVRSLSSGEQHLVAMFTQLIFAATEESIVLIDEPEISMHAAWKHAFLEDITEVSRVIGLQVILATHSTAIVNGRWDLVEELEAPQIEGDLHAPDRSADATVEDHDEWLGE